MRDDQLLRYSRHILLDELGIEAQQKWLAAHAVIIGAGGLGSPAAMYLAAAGVGTLTLIDDDVVELTNLQRQIVHANDTLGQPKAESASITLKRLNPGIVVNAVVRRADAALLDEWVPRASIVLDCSDNFATRHAVNRACVAHRVPLVSGAALRFDGQLSTFDSRLPESPCYACLFPEDQPLEEAACATLGVFAPIVGVIGTLEAAQALRLLAGGGPSLIGRLMLFDGWNMQWNEIAISRQADCAVCGTGHRPA